MSLEGPGDIDIIRLGSKRMTLLLLRQDQALCSWSVLGVAGGVCFADVVNSVPSIQGSPFFFTYVRGGEFIAVLVGWSFLLGHMTISALSARALAEHFDCIIGGKLREFFTAVFPVISDEDYINCFALAIVMAVIGYVAVGAKRNNVSHYATDVTALIALFLIVTVGFIKGDGDNYSKGVPFFYHGTEGVSQGAAVCFYLFTGYEAITTFTRNPYSHMLQKQVTSIMASSLFNFVAFTLAATFMLFVVSSDNMNNDCPFSSQGFDGQQWFKVVLNLLSLPALGVLMATNLFIVVHSFYSMSTEGIIPRAFGTLNRRTDTPLSSALVVGLVTGCLATILSQFKLLQISAIGTLFTYLLVCVSDILMRYRPIQTDNDDSWQHEDSNTEHDDVIEEPVSSNMTGNGSVINVENSVENNNVMFAKLKSIGNCEQTVHYTDTELSEESSESERETDDIDQIVAEYKEKLRVASLTHLENKRRKQVIEPTPFTFTLVHFCLISIMFCMSCIAAILHYYIKDLSQFNTITFTFFILACTFSIIASVTISKQPQVKVDWPSPIILFPWIPLISIFGYIYLLFSIDGPAWIVFSVWLFIGILVYSVYGTCHSVEAKRYTYVLPEEQERVLLQPIPKQSIMMELSPGQRKYKQNIGYQYFHEMQ
ncbi:solute carrier family 7 member 14-like [Antedon mediterranea]|uniref:solute carrier family 7 member 14-like n=1 Tax=Antedon mediterranea TaxID=105859 RepID=UPI003AF45B07